MAVSPHPAATDHLPWFITPPGQTDVLMVSMALFLAAAVLGFGVLFLRLHSLPERIAHKTHKVQFEIVAVLCLIALFTHMHIFWIAGLLLALVQIPDFGGPIGRIAESVEKMAGIKPSEDTSETSGQESAGIEPASHESPSQDASNAGEAAAPPASGAPGGQKELSHV